MAARDNGIVVRQIERSVEETVERIKSILSAKGITLFAVIDHSGEAAKSGLTMPNTKLLIFGNPKGGTPVMLAAPSAALDLPLKILVAEDVAGQVTVCWNSGEYLQQRHGIPESLLANIGVVEGLVKAAMAG